MSRSDRSLDIRAEHPKRIHVDRQMEEIGMQKAACDQLPDLESDRSIELRYIKVANRPERESGEQSWTGYSLKQKDGHVYADEQSCDSRHKNSLNVFAHFHTKLTKNHNGHGAWEIWYQNSVELPRGKRTKQPLCCFNSLVNSKKFPAFLFS